MPWCPVCRTEYEAGIANCSDCGTALTEAPPAEADPPVVVMEAQNAVQAQVAVATLRASGIPAYTQPTSVVLPQHSSPVMDTAPDLDVLVPAHLAFVAAEVLSEPPPTNEELEAAAVAAGDLDAGILDDQALDAEDWDDVQREMRESGHDQPSSSIEPPDD